MSNKPLHIYIISGEASGDLLGGKLMMALRRQNSDLTFSGLGGPKMRAQGLDSLFDNKELSLMGFAEVVPHIRKLKQRMEQVKNDIINKQPDIVVTIDSPGFNFRLIKQIKDSGKANNIKFLHYVAPTVWAYKPKRAAKIAKIFDKLLVLLPFEPPYFEKEGLPTKFVGHPVLEDDYTHSDSDALREKHGILPNTPILLLLPGSRPTEIKRHLNIFRQTVNKLTKEFPDLTEIIIVPENMREEITPDLANWTGSPIIITEQHEKHDAFAAATVALVKSGTISLELACAAVPMIITYKVSKTTAWLLRRMTKIKWFSLVNILLQKEILPELMQENCHADKLAPQIANLLENKNKREQQVQDAQSALDMLIPENGQMPSQIAATEVIALAQKN